MGLKTYQKKRDFRKTSEPAGKVKKSKSGHLYLIHKHAARRLHYDLRLELNGVLKSWAVPKGPSLDPSEKRLAVHVEDHPVDYGSFEGIIPKDEYGGGTVMLWDKGEWEPENDPEDGYKKGRLKFKLKGKRLRGSWALARMSGEASDDGKNWLLIKHRDNEAKNLKDFDILKEETDSVETGRSMDEIADDKDDVWHSSDSNGKKSKKPSTGNIKRSNTPAKQIKTAGLEKAKKTALPNKIKPMLASLVSDPPKGDDWLHEIKLDGYRILCRIDDGSVKLITRNGNDWTKTFSAIAKAAKALQLKQAVIDGEVVVLRPNGTTDFQALQNILKGVEKGTLFYYVFDILYFEGYDLTKMPLIKRKELLEQVVKNGKRTRLIRYSDHIKSQGESVFKNACQYSLEGIISKKADSSYEQKRSRNWLKIKCVKRQEFVIGGYTEPGGSRKGFGALLVGYYSGSDLIYAGRVGTGFDDKTLRTITPMLKKIERKTTSFKKPPTGREAKGVHWVQPRLVAEVIFAAWTNEGLLRAPSFKGLREDKKPKEVVRENKLSPKKTQSEAKKSLSQKLSGGNPMSKNGKNVIAGVLLSNPDKVLYPENGITKSRVAEYYEQVAEWMLPFVAKRPLTLVRCPDGYKKQCFYQKHVNDAVPDAIRGIKIREKEGDEIYIVIDDTRGLVSLAQMGALEIHPWGSREDKIEKPDIMIFDLDPDAAVAWKDVIAAAFLLRDRLQNLGLTSFVKTSGGKGLHVIVPLARSSSWDEMKAFSEAITKSIVKEGPDKYIATMSKEKRKNKIFIDFFRNTRGATNVAPYSTRAREGAPVSMPVGWDELTPKLKADGFNIENSLKRLKSLKKDPWDKFFATNQNITAAMKKRLAPATLL